MSTTALVKRKVKAVEAEVIESPEQEQGQKPEIPLKTLEECFVEICKREIALKVEIKRVKDRRKVLEDELVKQKNMGQYEWKFPQEENNG